MSLMLAALSIKFDSVKKKIFSKPKLWKNKCSQSLCKRFPKIYSDDGLKANQPDKFGVISVKLWNTDTWLSFDITRQFLRKWAKNHFSQIQVSEFLVCENNIMEIRYRFRRGEEFRILYSEDGLYPPYDGPNDKRIPKHRFLAKDVESAFLCNDTDTLSSESEIDIDDEYLDLDVISQESDERKDVTNLILSLRGPGKLFYSDTGFAINIDELSEWVKIYHKYKFPVLVINWTDDSKSIL